MAPLGWSLSSTTMDELEKALDVKSRDGDGKATGRRQNLRMVQWWLGRETIPARFQARFQARFEENLNRCISVPLSETQPTSSAGSPKASRPPSIPAPR